MCIDILHCIDILQIWIERYSSQNAQDNWISINVMSIVQPLHNSQCNDDDDDDKHSGKAFLRAALCASNNLWQEARCGASTLLMPSDFLLRLCFKSIAEYILPRFNWHSVAQVNSNFPLQLHPVAKVTKEH